MYTTNNFDYRKADYEYLPMHQEQEFKPLVITNWHNYSADQIAAIHRYNNQDLLTDNLQLEVIGISNGVPSFGTFAELPF